MIGDVDGSNNITFGSTYGFASGGDTQYHTTALLGGSTFMILYKAGTVGKAIINEIDLSSYHSIISTVDALPTNVATIELLPIQLEGDLDAGTPTYQALTETYSTVNAGTAKAVATLSADSGDYADIKVKVNNTDLNEVNLTRIQVDFQV